MASTSNGALHPARRVIHPAGKIRARRHDISEKRFYKNWTLWKTFAVQPSYWSWSSRWRMSGIGRCIRRMKSLGSVVTSWRIHFHPACPSYPISSTATQDSPSKQSSI